MRYVTTKDNCRLYVKDWGTGRPVVMTHGWPLSADSFDDLSMAIADAGMRAISVGARRYSWPLRWDFTSAWQHTKSILQSTCADLVRNASFSIRSHSLPIRQRDFSVQFFPLSKP